MKRTYSPLPPPDSGCDALETFVSAILILCLVTALAVCGASFRPVPPDPQTGVVAASLSANGDRAL